MATNKERLDAIDHRLEGIDGRLDRIDAALGLKPPSPPRRVGARAIDWLKANTWISIPSGVVVSIALALFGYWLNNHTMWFNQDVDGRVKSVLNEPNGVQQTLTDIQKTVTETKTKLETLEPFIQDIVRHQFDNAANLTPKTLGQRLPAIRHLVAVAQNQQITVDTQVVGRLADNLHSVKSDAPEFWPAVGELINYRSFNFNQSILELLTKQLPDCLDTDPGPAIIAAVQSDTQMTVTKPVFRDCRLTLDSASDDERLYKLVKEKYPLVVFSHCLIVYRGGQINLFLKWTGQQHIRMGIFPKGQAETNNVVDWTPNGDALTFDQCLFDFRLQGPPSESGQKVAQGLLAQSTAIIGIPLGPRS
jgi:hypothetical protein